GPCVKSCRARWIRKTKCPARKKAGRQNDREIGHRIIGASGDRGIGKEKSHHGDTEKNRAIEINEREAGSWDPSERFAFNYPITRLLNYQILRASVSPW